MAVLRTFQEKLILPLVLSLSIKQGYYTLKADGCDRQIGCVLLLKRDNNVNKSTSYWSEVLVNHDRNLYAIDRQYLAIVVDILPLRPYLEGTTFTVRLNRHALKWILNLVEATGSLAR